MLLLRRVVAVPLVLFGVPAFGMYAAELFAGHRYRLFGFAIGGGLWGEGLAEVSLGTAVFGVLPLLSVFAARLVCGGSRRRLAAVFGPLVRGVSVGVAILALLQMAVTIASAMMLTLVFLHVIPLGLLLPVLVGGFYTAAQLVRIGLGLSAPLEERVVGLALRRAEQPAIWRKLDEVAARLDARVPDHVLLGLEPGFFATGAALRLPDGTVLRGETLRLSLAGLRILSEPQLLAVMGHELSHFVGDDTRYSLRFVPIFERLQQGLAVAYETRGFAAVTAMPPRVILGEALLAFAKTKARIGRAREIAADQAGASVAGGRAVVSAVLLEAISFGLWPAVMRQVIDTINTGAPMFAPCERLEAFTLAQMH